MDWKGVNGDLMVIWWDIMVIEWIPMVIWWDIMVIEWIPMVIEGILILMVI